MKVARTIEETRAAIRGARIAGRTIGLVPTMGFLHQGHVSLIRVAREHGADFIVVSIFVNPLQFAPNEDFERYPRDEERDRKLLEHQGVDLAFMPAVDVMYPPGATARVVLTGVAEPLEGERRPGHFNGVATVVLKLFNIVQPDLAVFGRKDAQQCEVIERMVRCPGAAGVRRDDPRARRSGDVITQQLFVCRAAHARPGAASRAARRRRGTAARAPSGR